MPDQGVLPQGLVIAAPRLRLHAARRRLGAPWLSGAALLVSLAALLPLGFVLWVTASTGWETIATLLLRPRVAELLGNTLLLVLLTVPLCAALALALAWLTERSDLPGARLCSWLAVAPLAVPAFVQSYAWVTLLPGLQGLRGGVLVSVLAYFPFLYLPLAAALRRLDPALEDGAAALGMAPARVFRRVLLPQLRLAFCGGALLVALHLLAEFGLYAMIRFDTFTTAIIDQFQSTYNGPAANMLGVVLVLLCLALLALEARWRGRARYARLGSGAARPASRARLGRWRWPALVLPLGTAALSLGVPAWMLGRWLWAGGAGIWRWAEIGPALGQTLLLSVGGAALTVAAAFPMAWLSIRHPGRLQRGLEGANFITGALPGVVVALALVTVTVRVALPLYQSLFTILLAYALMFLPRGIIGLRASLAQAPVELEQAAGSLGRSPARALWSVTLRLAAPGVAAGMAMVSLGITNELTATQMLAPNGTRTLATAFWAYSGEIDYAAAAPYALGMILLSSPLAWLLHRQSLRAAGR